MDNKDPSKQAPPLPLWKVVASALAAVFGVQSKENAQRDFAQGKLSTFVMIGVGIALFFIIVIATIVSTVVNSAHPH